MWTFLWVGLQTLINVLKTQIETQYRGEGLQFSSWFLTSICHVNNFMKFNPKQDPDKSSLKALNKFPPNL